jgi:hypothetical protein
MPNGRPPLVIAHRRGHSRNGSVSSNSALKMALWIVWLPIAAILWIVLLDTSYDWISSPSTSKVFAGLLLLILMTLVIIGLIAKGVRKLWRGGLGKWI